MLDLIQATLQVPDIADFLPELLTQIAAACGAAGAAFEFWAPRQLLAASGEIDLELKCFPAYNQYLTVGTLNLYFEGTTELPPELQSGISTLASVIAIRLLEARDAAQQAAILKGIAHDVRGAIRRSTSLFELASGNPALASQAEAEIAGLEKLLRDVGSFANATQRPAKPPARLEWPDVQQAVRWRLKTLPDANPTFLPSDAAVWAREDELADILFRLIENAATFAPQSPPRVSMTRRDGGAEIQVSDQGPGIEARYAEQIFSPFFRLHGKQFPGHGLGLSICLRIVASHSGKIEAVPTQGGGLTIRIWLPDPAHLSALPGWPEG
ncbi:MAG: HAMP domain-containing histidine kinase [Bryobacteraceae bacterium]|nr:HAMP domain-containing histidine kinase [Bryobacteraceae bacterium]